MSQMKNDVSFMIDTLSCPNCFQSIEWDLQQIESIDRIRVNIYSSKVKVTVSANMNKKELSLLLYKLGYPVKAPKQLEKSI